MSAATLGDFFDTAYEHFAAAGTNLRDGLQDYPGAAAEMGRLARVMSRYLDAVTRPNVLTMADAPSWELTTATMRQAVQAASQHLKQATANVVTGLPQPDDPAVHHFGLAANALIAGTDLLWSHVSLDQDGSRVPQTDWARLLNSEPFALAVTDEVISWARRITPVMELLAAAPGQYQCLSSSPLRSARDLVQSVIGIREPVSSDTYDITSHRELLRATPLARSPRPVPLSVAESDSDLCRGIENSSQRLGTAAFANARLPGDSLRLTKDSWRKSSRSSAVISDLAYGLTAALADRAAALGIPPAAEDGLRRAGEAFQEASTAWKQVTEMWRPIETETKVPAPVPFPDRSDLVLRMGRLLVGKPDWAPGLRAVSVPRSPNSLAASKPGFLRTTAAVHQAADAITRLGVADLKSVQSADEAERLYVKNDALYGPTARYRYVRLAGHQAHLVMNAYHIAIRASLRAATALGNVALTVDSSSKVLAVARTAAEDVMPSPEPGYELDPLVFTRHRRPYFEHTSGGLRNYKQLDADAVIQAYKESGLSVRQCAERFTASRSAISSVLAFSGLKPRNSRWHDDETFQAPKPDEPKVSQEASRTNADAPVTLALKDLGVTDPVIHQRAAVIDRAAAALLHQAAYQALPAEPASGARRTAAGVASLDNPVPSPRTVRKATPPLVTEDAVRSTSRSLNGARGRRTR